MSDSPYKHWEPVIGLEIHAQLNTRTKIFSRAPNCFGMEPNTAIGVVDTGQPGTLPVLNREVVRKAVLLGIALESEIAHSSKFDRKSYFYPDCPRNFQITQYYDPIIKGGFVIADVDGAPKEFRIHHAHLEDDAGMLKHFTNFAGVDYNRAGVPLIEIVSMPCMHSPKEASAYAMAIKAILEYLGASTCNMEEGALRMDVNVSVRPRGTDEMRNKVEIKNMNSFHNMELAIESEIKRQVGLYIAHPDKTADELIPNATFRFDLQKGQTVMMRKKESADDYRYFPEPDLPPIHITPEYIDRVKKDLPELPRQRYIRYREELELTEFSSNLLISDKALCEIFEEALHYTKNAKSLCNWLTVEFVGRLKDTKIKIPAEHIAQLVNLIDEKVINGKIAKSVADDMIANPEKAPKLIVEENPDYKPLSDSGAIETIIDEVLAANPDSIESYKAGRDRAFNFLVGQVMKASNGKASPDIVRDTLKKKLD